MDDSDLIIARQLQEKYDKESAAFFVSGNEQIDRLTNQTKNGGSWSTHSQLSVVDPSLEISDPNPDVRALFLHFNEEYFWGRLAGVEVRWSPRMTLCAGMCHYEGRGGLCSIRLSVPLLKLRPRKDLVETLLHEMIHAFLFVADNDREREEHGPNFKKHMHRINKASGANITIYHSFHDEVDSYRQHWWRCDGPCRNRPPYYGWVKRAMNRAPSARDLWWEDHARSCGGSYTKVKEPEGYGAKKTGAKEQKKDKGESKGKNKDIRSFFGDGQILGVSTPKKTGTTSGVNKKPTSTVTASGSSSSSPTTIPHATNNTHTNSNIPSGQEMDDDFPMDAFWGGGIWADELDNIPELSSDTPSENSDISTGVPSNQQKNWTVVETKNDREVRLNSGASDSKSEKLKGAGQVLGQGSGEGESWLAKLRKQWAQETKTSKSPSRISDKKNAGDKTKQADSHFKKTVSAKNKSGTETKPTETDDFEIPDALIFSDDSHHSSFHVSSCEEDSWPSPESYKTKHKHSKASSGKELHRKRSVMDLVSSDKDDFDVPGVSKRAKSASDSSRSKGGKQQDLGLSNSSQQRNMKISSKDKGGSQRNQKINGGDAVRSGTEASMPSLGADANHNFGESSGRNEDDVSLVPCPVCQRKVAADDINRHLDECLS